MSRVSLGSGGALGALALVCLVGGCGCFGGSAQPRDAGGDVEEPPPIDGSCGLSVPVWPSSPTHSVEVTVSQVLLHDEVTRTNEVAAAFVDELGLIVFESWHILRATFDGKLLSATPLPTAPDGDSLLPQVVQGGTNYAGLSLSGYLCMIALDGTTDPASCSKVAEGSSQLPLLSWDGSTYAGYSEWDWRTTTMRLALHDATGNLTEQHLFPGPVPNTHGGLAVLSPEKVVIVTSANRSACASEFLDVLPRSFDTGARTITEVMPPGFCREVGGLPLVRTPRSPDRIAWLGAVQCQERREDGHTQPILTVLTMARRDGTLVEGGSHPIPGAQVSWLNAVWDGERFVLLGYDHSVYNFFVHTFDEDGNLQAQAVPIPFTKPLPESAASNGVLTAVGPNDYIVILNVPLGYNSFMRFRLGSP